jgi:hypothetical protein
MPQYQPSQGGGSGATDAMLSKLSNMNIDTNALNAKAKANNQYGLSLWE